MTQIICLIVMIVFFFTAVKIMSDRISERMKRNRTLLTVISLILSMFSSFGGAIWVKYYIHTEFPLLIFILNVFSTFSIYLGLSIIIGAIKRTIDENRKNKDFYKSLDIDKMLEEQRKIRLSKKIINFEKKKREKEKKSKTSN